MKKSEKIESNVINNKDLQKNIAKLRYYSNSQFISDAKTYIQAIKKGRMIVNISSVSSSGMSRVMSFYSCEKNKSNDNHYYRNYTCLFIALGYSEAKNKNSGFRISGCGMPMVFATNYNNIRNFEKLGFISKKQRDILCQMTPTYH